MKAPTLLLWLSVFAVAHDQPLSDRQKDQVAKVRPQLKGAVDVAHAKALRDALSSFTLDGLRELDHQKEFRDLTEDEQDHLRHALRAIVFAMEHERDLRDPWLPGVLLGSTAWTDWMAAIRLLQKETFDDGLERVATSLALDSRPQVRLGAGRIAKALTCLRGPSPACTAIAKRLLADPVPNVVALFGAFDAHDFRDKEITDMVVARVRDERELDLIPGATPFPGRVVDYVAPRLFGEIHMYGGEIDEDDVRSIEPWWRKNRDRYDYGPDPEKWELAGSWRGTRKKNEESEIAVGEGRVWFTVLDYAEYWASEPDRPANDLTVRLRRDGEAAEKAGRIGSRLREDIERGSSGLGVDGDNYRMDYFVAPDTTGSFRISARIWQGKR